MKNLSLLLVLVFGVFINFSIACTRWEFGVPIEAEFTRADAVFIGKATKTEDLRGKDDYEDNGHALRVEFRVQRNFKGAEKRTFTLVTNDWRAACGLEKKKGQTWVIFAYYYDEDKVFGSNDGFEYEPKKHSEGIKVLMAAAEGKTETTIAGQLAAFGGLPYKHEAVEISVEGNGKQRTTITKSDGSFNFPALAPGKYKVRLKVPFRASVEHLIWDKSPKYTEGDPTTLEYEVKLKQGDYDFSFFEIIKHRK